MPRTQPYQLQAPLPTPTLPQPAQPQLTATMAFWKAASLTNLLCIHLVTFQKMAISVWQFQQTSVYQHHQLPDLLSLARQVVSLVRLRLHGIQEQEF